MQKKSKDESPELTEQDQDISELETLTDFTQDVNYQQFVALKIPVCSQCGSRKLTDDYNQVFCPENNSDCPLLKS